MAINYILFDMDGLLTDSERLSFETLHEIINEYGFELDRKQYCNIIGKNNDACKRLLQEMFLGLNGTEVIAEYGVRFSKAVNDGKLYLKKGVHEILDLCDRLGIKKAVASSNNGKYVRFSLGSCGILDRMDLLVYDEMVANAKPAPDLFLKAAELLNAPHDECLVLEDSYAGVMAAHAAGIPVIVVPDMIAPNEEILSMCVRSADSLLDVIDYINSTGKVS
ncbi:MAG: HAD family phosphatase [Oscillospiraceae bacterium]